MKCGFLIRNDYNDYECDATGKSIGYDKYINICTTTRFVDECKTYRDHCHVSTMIFDMMGKCEDCGERKLIAKLRMFASQNPDLSFMLDIYDGLGPKLALAIKEDNDYCEVYSLYKHKIIPICEDVMNNCYDMALVKYFRFIKNLSKKYSDDIDLSNYLIDNDDKNTYVKFRKNVRKNVNV